ncbi:uncharacterized protein LOC110655077 isoform X4 [Hevea brasiliensis]|uniref:uncharacterized protein LOC110655077 isoform X4 n=1 Tax=Hevea brasiliensis TaxID=3981 RepID=UPI0025DAF082|nr:uncharacterized protein LOC110655077 isoform X4 [Hevea brasiliensis]
MKGAGEYEATDGSRISGVSLEWPADSDICRMNCHHTTSSFASQVAPFSMDFLDDSPQFDAEEEALKTLVIRKKSGLSFLVHDDEVVQIFLKQIREELETFKGIRNS